MKVVLRADAGVDQGSGHVMRCLTLAEALRARGHDVELHASLPPLVWLSEFVERSGVALVEADPDRLDFATLATADAVVVDSYQIDADEVTALATRTAVLAIVDGDLRGIRAPLYLDQNLGAEERDWLLPEGSRILAGAGYSLVRDAILDLRRVDPWRMQDPARVLLVLGGTDPRGLTAQAASALAALGDRIALSVVADGAQLAAVQAVAPNATLIESTPELPAVLAAADVVVSAAGTSAWDVCALGVPAVLLAVADNQLDSLRAALRANAVLGLDLESEERVDLTDLPGLVAAILDEESLRRSLSAAARHAVDGLGKGRVAEALEECVGASSRR